MSRLMDPPPKFLPPEWRLANQIHYGNAEAERSRSERLTAESKRLIEESGMAAKRMQQDASKRLEQRIHDIKFWRTELDQKLEEIVQEIEVLISYKSRVERALESCAEPLRVALQCMTERQRRVSIDLVHDDVERELMKEREVIEGVTSLLNRTLEQTNEQISATVTPEEWETFSNINILKAEREKNNSLSLRALVDSLLEQTAADMRRQHNAMGTALRLQVQETKTAKGQLEDHLVKVLSEVASQECNLEALRVAIEDKAGPLKVAQTRLSARSQRPSIELCRDPVQVRLLSEVQELTAHIKRLREAQAQSEMELLALTRSQLILEEEIQVKSHSLYIDEVICTQLRQPISIHSF
ncbi:tektin-1 isoform X2 [Salmo salar]|uniref:Tektin n=1 Tax=Salmo salar TaxID=8030 RepID=A0A1S3NQI8_SALSA|nr:tektin-1 isoform X2 [Salmo salar]